MPTPQEEFLQFALESGVLTFGDFTTKSGRRTPYFFNAGRFDGGGALGRLGRFYAQAILRARAAGLVHFDMLFGPAYKGIALAAATAIGLAGEGLDVPFSYNRKEAKDHGEGGVLVGAPLRGRVLVIDDVITDGAAKREAVGIIRAAGAEPAGVVILLDRQERLGEEGGAAGVSAVQAFEKATGTPVLALATLADLLTLLRRSPGSVPGADLAAVEQYRLRYGVE